MAAQCKYRGFTLIELMVVVGIILIITGSTIPSLTSYMHNQAVRQAQQQLISDMRSTQVKALTGTLSDTEVNGSPIRYWGINFASDGASANQYTIFVNSAAACNTNADDIKDTGVLPTSVTQKSVGADILPSCILFEMLNGDIVIPGSSFNTRSIVVGYASDDGSDKKATFNRMGLIYAED